MVDTTLNDETLAVHNKLRANHDCPPIKFDSVLARSAQSYAETLADNQCMYHSAQENYGENLAFYGSPDNAELSGLDASLMWYNQIKMHDFSGGRTNETCYFSQLIWKDTRVAGFGRAYSKDRHGVYFVGHYGPKGNTDSQFQNNVPRPRQEVTRIADDVRRTTMAKSIISHTSLNESKEARKEREKREKRERDQMEKQRKEREKQAKRQEKKEKKERRKSGN